MKDNCEVCGCELTQENRSKSYKNRCKACVAKQTKEKRSEQKQSAKDKVNTNDVLL